MKSTFALALFVAGGHVLGQTITLPEALAAARSHRMSVPAATDAVSASRATGAAATAGPPLVLGAGATSRTGLGATDQDLFIAYSPDLFGRTAAARKMADAAHFRVLAEQRRTLLEVQSDVMSAYIEAYAVGRQTVAAAGLLEVAEALFMAAQRRFEEGKVPEVQLALARVQRDRANQTVVHLKSKERAALRRLAGAMGSRDVPTSVAALDLAEPEVQVGMRPDVMLVFAESAIAEAEALAAARENAPDFELTALRSPWSDPASQVALRVQLTWRIGDFGKTRSSVNAARLRARSFHSHVEDLMQRAQAELDANALEVESAKARLESSEAIRRAAIDLAAKSQRGFAEGIGTLLDVLEATRALRDLELEVVEIEREYLVALVARYTASGALLEVAS